MPDTNKGTNMKYSELLLQPQWFEKCNDILHRDRFKCQKCGKIGFHNSSYFECQTADELDCLLEGFLIKEDKPSVFLNKISEYSLRDFEIYQKDLDEPIKNQTIDGKILYDLSISIGLFDEPFALFVASESRIKDTKCKGYFLFRKGDPVKLSPEIDFKYDKGCYVLLNNSYFDKYIVRIEKLWPTGAVDDGFGHPIIWGSIVISICYQNSGVTLYFYDETIDKDKNPKGLNIHHKYYVKDKAPWEYEDDALITLCQECHGIEHKTKKTPVYRNIHLKDISGYAQICDRCGGEGYLPQYDHVEHGICFKCYGEGVIFDY